MLMSKTVIQKWNRRTKKYYEEKGYKFTKDGEEFEIRVEDLTKGSNVYVKVKCDCPKCKNPYLQIQWISYLKYVKEGEKYYCNNCMHLLFAGKNGRKTKLEKSISFEQWCIDNNRQDVLDRWDYELNDCKPSEASYSTMKKYYFKCPKGLHKSELKNINSYTNPSIKHNNYINCKSCNSVAQFLIDTYGENALNLYWDYEKNTVDPWKISKCNDKKVWIKCQEFHYHDSYNVRCSDFSLKNSRCPICNFSKGEKRIENYFIQNNFIKSSDKECNRFEIDSKKYYIPQKEFNRLIGLKGGNLSYDFYLPQYNLLIEYQGEFHDGNGNYFMKQNLKQQKEHDRRKKEYAKENNIKLLEIWYWDFDNIEEILDVELENSSEDNLK